jgi:hypothetical protein
VLLKSDPLDFGRVVVDAAGLGGHVCQTLAQRLLDDDPDFPLLRAITYSRSK